MTDIETLFREARDFLENAPAARLAAKPLWRGAVVALRVDGFADEFHVIKVDEGFALRRGAVAQPDWTATVMPRTLLALRDMREYEIGDLGVEIFKRMAAAILEPQADDQIKVRLNRGFLGIARRGYFGILPLGGPKVARYLAAHGLKSVSGIRNVFKALRGSDD